MPDLPTFTLTAAQAAYLSDLFGGAAGYKRWLKAALLSEIDARIIASADEAAMAARKAALDDAKAKAGVAGVEV